MASTYWTDPKGQQHQYATAGGGLQGGARQALERERTWSGLDPSYDSRKFDVNAKGVISKESSAFNPWLAAAVLGGPLAAAFLPGLFAGGAAGASGGTGAAAGAGAATDLGGMVPAAVGAGATGAGRSVLDASALEGLGSGGGLMNALKGMVNSPGDIANLGGIIATLSGALKGGGGNSAAAEHLNQMTEQRMRRVDPLHQAVTQLAWGRLPTNARQGITPPTYQPLP